MSNTILKVWDDQKAESFTKWMDKGGWREGDTAILDGAQIKCKHWYTATELKTEIRNHNLNCLPKIEYADVTYRLRGEYTDQVLIEDANDLWPNDQTVV